MEILLMDGPITFLVPLAGSPRTRRLVVRRLLRETSRAAADAGPITVLHRSDPGDLPVALFGAGVVLRDPVEVLSPDEIDEVVTRVHRTTENAIGGDGGLSFAWRGVDLGVLNLMEIRHALVDAHLLADAAMRIHIDSGGRTTGRILAPYPELVDFLASAVQGLELTAWYPWRMGPTGRNLKNSLRAIGGLLKNRKSCSMLRRLASELEQFQGSRAILFWAESVPMIQMFDSVVHELSGVPGASPTITVELLRKPERLQEISAGRWRVRVESPQKGSGVGEAIDLSDHWSRIGEAKGRDDELHGYLRFLIESLYHDGFTRQAAYIDDVALVLDKLNPSIVVTGNDRFWVGQALVHLARARDIPSLAVQDGVMAQTTPWTSAWADHVAVNGEYLGRVLGTHGFPSDRWSITGQPRYDAMLRMDREQARGRVRKGLGITTGSSVVLFVTQPYLGEEYVRDVARTLESVEGALVALRPHPSESDRVHRNIAEASEGRIRIARDQPILELIAASDVVVLESSTVALEAAALGTPVVSTAFTSETIPAHVAAATEFHPRTLRELFDVVQALVAETSDSNTSFATNHADRLEDFLGPLDGRASERVADLILSLRATGIRKCSTAPTQESSRHE